MIRLVIILTLISSKALAGFQFGASIYQLNQPDTIKASQQINFNLGYAKTFDKVFISSSTNRLFTNRQFAVLKNGLRTETKAYIDSLATGYVLGRFMPSIYLARVDARTNVYAIKQVKRQREIDIVYGTALNYFLTKDLYSSFIVVAPNKNLNLKTSFGISLTKLL